MPNKNAETTRTPRADGVRNRGLLLEIAKKIFSSKGADVSFEEIARAAGVGIGTLYRHFPTREALVQEVYRNEMEQLVAEASLLSSKYTPEEALRKWLYLFVEYLATQRLLTETLEVIPTSVKSIEWTSGIHMGQAVAALVKQAAEFKAVVVRIEPSDLLRALVGAATIYPEPAWEHNAKALADVLIAGLLFSPR